MSLDWDETLAPIVQRLPSLARALRPGARLGTLGLDSLDQVELMMVIHELYGIRLEIEELSAERTVGELAERIAARAEEVPRR
jgi:acyl carrier protein